MEAVFNAGKFSLEGKMTKCELFEEKGGVAPTNTIRSDQDWGVNVDWHLKGYLKQPFFVFQGEFTVTLYLEGMGKEAEDYDFKTTVKVTEFKEDPDDAQKRNYTAKVTINKGAVEPGTYLAVGAITYSAEGTPGPLAAHMRADPEMVQIYQVQEA